MSESSKIFNELYKNELKQAESNFIMKIGQMFDEAGLKFEVVKKQGDDNYFIRVNGVPMRLMKHEESQFGRQRHIHWRMIFQQYKIICKAMPEMMVSPLYKKLFPQTAFYNVEDVVAHFRKDHVIEGQTINILKIGQKLRNASRFGVFENILSFKNFK